jgi:hypothetical protein
MSLSGRHTDIDAYKYSDGDTNAVNFSDINSDEYADGHTDSDASISALLRSNTHDWNCGFRQRDAAGPA